MKKEEALEIIRLLSALQSWSFASERMLPDYLHGQLAIAIKNLSRVVLEHAVVETQKTNRSAVKIGGI